jgi:hypothetical protein
MRRTLKDPRARASGWQVSMNKGIVMNAWFDVPPMGPEMFSKVDQKVLDCPNRSPSVRHWEGNVQSRSIRNFDAHAYRRPRNLVCWFSSPLAAHPLSLADGRGVNAGNRA